MKLTYNKPLYENGIMESDKDRAFELSRGLYLNIPAGANYVVVQRPPKKRSRQIDIYYQKRLLGTDSPAWAFGKETFSSGLREIIIRELKNLKSN